MTKIKNIVAAKIITDLEEFKLEPKIVPRPKPKQEIKEIDEGKIKCPWCHGTKKEKWGWLTLTCWRCYGLGKLKPSRIKDVKWMEKDGK